LRRARDGELTRVGGVYLHRGRDYATEPIEELVVAGSLADPDPGAEAMRLVPTDAGRERFAELAPQPAPPGHPGDLPPGEGEHVYRDNVPPPTSRKQIDRLGRRIAESARVDAGDRALFADILDFYQELLDAVCNSLTAMDLTPTSRVKTTSTLVEKLQRDHGMQLSRIQDVAGARVVLDGDRADQDVLVKQICDLFSHFPRQSDVIDRRASPRQGYRAVHVIVYPDGFPVEIQVRTNLQDIWAQIFERIADQWGRQIRYGQPPDPPSLDRKTETEHGKDVDLRSRTVALLMRISDSIDAVEDRRMQVRQAQKLLEDAVSATASFRKGMLRDLSIEEVAAYRKFQRTSAQTLVHLKFDKRKRGRLIRRNLPNERVDPEKCGRVMKILGGPLSSDMLKLIELTHYQEEMLRKALDHISQIPEDS